MNYYPVSSVPSRQTLSHPHWGDNISREPNVLFKAIDWCVDSVVSLIGYSELDTPASLENHQIDEEKSITRNEIAHLIIRIDVLINYLKEFKPLADEELKKLHTPCQNSESVYINCSYLERKSELDYLESKRLELKDLCLKL